MKLFSGTSFDKEQKGERPFWPVYLRAVVNILLQRNQKVCPRKQFHYWVWIQMTTCVRKAHLPCSHPLLSQLKGLLEAFRWPLKWWPKYGWILTSWPIFGGSKKFLRLGMSTWQAFWFGLKPGLVQKWCLTLGPRWVAPNCSLGSASINLIFLGGVGPFSYFISPKPGSLNHWPWPLLKQNMFSCQALLLEPYLATGWK